MSHTAHNRQHTTVKTHKDEPGRTDREVHQPGREGGRAGRAEGASRACQEVSLQLASRVHDWLISMPH